MMWRETWKSWMERGHWDIDASATVNASQWFRHSNGRLIPLYCSKRKLTCFWAICHRLPLSRRTPVWLGRSSKNMYINGPESWSHSAIDSLKRWLLQHSAAINSSLKKEEKKKKKKDAVGWRQSYRHTVSNRYQVFDVTCIALWVCQWIFPI